MYLSMFKHSGFAIAVFVGVFLEHNNLSVLPREDKHLFSITAQKHRYASARRKHKETRLNQRVFPGVGT